MNVKYPLYRSAFIFPFLSELTPQQPTRILFAEVHVTATTKAKAGAQRVLASV
jgi:hypothetical protein